MPTLQSEELRLLADGLRLRRAASDDVETIAELQARAHSDAGWDTPDEEVRFWIRDLLTRPHPTFRPADFIVVEVLQTGAIVSSMCLISQTWRYGPIPFGVGRPELVATHPDYRRRGLVRAQFELVHALSAERGELLQAITGIPWYY
ncbi:MAG: GNAT family N-acetyltransferase, partial [Anaerolineae bacterium]|nr:GNAT family N-acetyltransferase [Anaerolineae bacterium]